MGDDNRVVDAARVSFAKRAEEYPKDKNERLISFLAREEHWAPFAHPQICLREHYPIFLARQRMKHQAGFIYSEISARYASSEHEYYFPDKWRGAPANRKQGSSDVEITKVQLWDPIVGFDTGHPPWEPGEVASYAYNNSEAAYQTLVLGGVAPEQARMVLPVGVYTSLMVTGSLFGYARSYLLRTTGGYQKDWDAVTQRWDEIIRPLFPVSWAELVD